MLSKLKFPFLRKRQHNLLTNKIEVPKSSNSFYKYLIVASLLIIVSSIGFTLYRQSIEKAKSGLAYSTASSPVYSDRFLSFQGRLTDSSGNPINSETNILFELYNVPTMGAGSTLYTSATGNSQTVTPDDNGIFSVTIGQSHGTTIPDTVFTQNSSVYLQITAGGEVMEPRQPIATVAYAINAESLQGLPPSASGLKNTVLVVDGNGNLNLGETSPTIKSTSGILAIEGQAVLIKASDSSGGNIEINPDANGIIKLTTEGNGSTAVNGFIDASNANLSTGNLYSATIRNTNRGYNFIDLRNYNIGGTQLSTRFSVDAYGNTFIGGTLSPTNISIGNTLIISSASEINLLDNLLSTNGSIIYGNGSNLANSAVGTSGQVLMSNGAAAPTWINSSTFGQSYTAGVGLSLSPSNSFSVDYDSTFDLDGNKIGLNLGSTNIWTAVQTFNNGIGVSGTSYFANNLGIGTTNPLALLDINGTAQIISSELITNGSFTGNANGWNLYDGASYNTNNVTVTSGGGVETDFNISNGKTYLLTFTLLNSNNEEVYIYFSDVDSYPSTDFFTDGTHSITFTGNQDGVETIWFESWNWNTNGTWTIDDVSIKEISSNLPTLKVIGFDNKTALSLGNYSNNNTALGLSSFASILTGNNNSSFGSNSLAKNINGFKNSAFGSNSLGNNTSGARNSSFGSYSLFSNTTGNNNSSFGENSLFYNTNGINNSAFGFNSLYSNRTGGNNTAIGYYALGSGTTLTSNIAVGNGAGSGLSVGSSNIFIGNNNGNFGTYNNRLYIGNGQNPIIYGDMSNNQISIGTTTTGYTLNVGGTLNAASIFQNGSPFSSGITTATNGLSLVGGAFGLGGTLTQNTSIGTSSFGLSFLGLGNTQSLYIASNGYVGIGTTSPTTSFNIAGYGDQTLFQIDASRYGFSTKLNGESISIQNNFTGGGWARSLLSFLDASTNPYFEFGSFGVGQTFNYGYIGQSYDGNAIRWSGDNVSISTGGVSSPSQPLIVGDQFLVVASWGNVGINNNDPQYKLDVTGDGNFSTNLSVGGTLTLSQGAVNGYILSTNASGNTSWINPSSIGTTYTATNGLSLVGGAFGLGGTLTQNTQIGTSSFSLSFLGLGNTQGLYLSSNGYVGIGTTNPGAPLEIGGVSGEISTTSGDLTLNAGSSIVSFSNNSLEDIKNITIGGTFVSVGSTNLVSNLNADYLDGLDSTQLLQIGSTGSFIYTASNGLTLASNNFKLGGQIIENTRLNIGNTEVLYIQANGNMSIGNTSPGTYKLSVTGTGYYSSTITTGGDVYLQGGDVYDNSADLKVSAEDNLLFTIDYNNNDADVTYFSWGKNTGVGATHNGSTELMRLTETGRLGIGTTNPTQKLEVIGNGYFSTNLSVGGTLTLSQGAVNGYILSSDASGNTSWINPSSIGSSSAVTNGLSLIGGAVGLGGTLTQNTSIGTSSFSLSFLGLGNTQGLYLSSNGYVGIGTTSPTALLEINSTAQTTGSELVTNGTFTGNANGWTLDGASYNTNNITGSGNNSNIGTTINTVSGKTYRVSSTLSNLSDAVVSAYLNNNGYQGTPFFKDGPNSFIFTSDYTGEDDLFFILLIGEGSWTIDDISVKEITTPSSAFKVVAHDGSNFLSYNNDSFDNTALGISSLKSNTSGYNNEAFGAYSLAANTSGDNNSAFGSYALFNNIDGFGNVGVGSFSLIQNTSGNFNLAIGAQSLASNTDGGGNVAIGFGSLMTKIGGDSNIAIGTMSGMGLTSGSGNIFIGHPGESGSYDNQLFIGSPASESPLIFGDLSINQVSIGTTTLGYTLNIGGTLNADTIFQNGAPLSGGSSQWTTIGNHIYYNDGFVGIGTSSPTSPLTIFNSSTAPAITLFNSDGTVNLEIRTDYGGILGNMFIGQGVGISNVSGNFNHIFGYDSFVSNTSGDNNNAFGLHSLYKNENGDDNNAFGTGTLYNNVSGQENSAFGSYALYENIDGEDNNAFGIGALNYNNGSYNSAFGSYSLRYHQTGDNNSSFGNGSLFSNRIGSNNTAIGSYALGSGTTLSGNIAIGGGAGSGLSVGSSNIFIGVNSGDIGSYDNRLYISNGYSSDPIIYGDMSNNYVGIGTTITKGRLTIASTGSTAPAISFLNNYGLPSLEIRTDSELSLYNSFFGVGVGQTNSNGSFNSAFGYSSFVSNIGGSGNSSLGAQSLLYNTNGSNNSAFGFSSLASNISGDDNSAFGFYSLTYKTSGDRNTAIGTHALGLGSTLNANIALGAFAGYNLSVGSSNIFIGTNNGASGSYNNRLYIGNGQNPIIYGDMSNNQISIGTTTTGYTLNVGGTLNAGSIFQNGSPLSGGSATATNGLQLISTSVGLGGTLTQNTSIGTSSFGLSFLGLGNTQSLYIASNGKIGIGTTNPSEKLQVAGNIVPDANLTYDIGTSSLRWNNAWIKTVNIGSSTWSLQSPDNSRLSFFNNSSGGTEVLTALTSGRVGIGTTNPNSPLNIGITSTTVVGTGSSLSINNLSANFIGSLASGKIYDQGNPYYALSLANSDDAKNSLGLSGTGSIKFNINDVGTTAKYISNGSASRIQSFFNGLSLDTGTTNIGGVDVAWNSQLFLHMNGKVGIGTTNPSEKLTVAGNIALSTGGYIYGDTTTPWINLSNSNGTFVGYGDSLIGIGYNSMGLNIGNTRVMTLSSNLRVGIGTTNPSEKLTVAGNIAPSANLTYDIGTSGLRWNNAWIKTVNIGSSTWSLQSPDNSRLSFFNNSSGGTEVFTALASGNVGMGTTNPITKTHVYGTLMIDPQGITNSWSEGLRIGTATNNYSIVTFGANTSSATGNQTNQWVIGKNGGDNSFWISGGSLGDNTFRILQSGNVGIGTANPSAKLDIAGASSTLRWTYSNEPSVYYAHSEFTPNGSDPNLTNLTFSVKSYPNASANQALTLTGSGNAGIGTASPSYKLHVNNGGSSWNARFQNTSGYIDIGPANSGGAHIYTDRAQFYMNAKITIIDDAISSYDAPLQLQSSGTARMWIRNDYNQLVFNARSNSSTTTIRGMLQGYGGNSLSIAVDTSDNYRVYWTHNDNSAYSTSWSGSSFDIAEWHPVGNSNLNSNGESTLEPGQVVCSDPQDKGKVIKCSKSNSQNLIGIITTNPWTIIGDNNMDNDHKSEEGIALSGQVPILVKTNSVNETISVGDILTSSSLPGFAQKTQQAGAVVAKAIESSNWNEQTCPLVSSIDSIVWPNKDDGKPDGMNQKKPCFRLPDGSYVGKILAYTFLSYYDPDLSLTATGQVSTNYNISNEVLSSLGYNGAKNEIESATYSISDSLGNTVTRLANFAEIASAKIKTGFLSATNIVTKNIVAENIISPKGTFDSLTATDIQATSVVTNELITNQLTAAEASVSTLYADNIISREGSIGDLMTAKISSLREELKSIVSKNESTPSAILAQSNDWSTYIASDSAKIEGDLALSNNLVVGSQLLVQGDTQLANAFITGTFTAGEIAIKDNFIETTNTALYIQPSQTGSIHLMGDTLVIADNGDVQINGNLTVTGSLFANLLRANEIETNKLTSTEIISHEIKIATDSSSTIIASDSNINLATNSAQLTSNATAGTATLPANKTELIINTNKLTTDSMVYLTPNGSTQNQVIYVKNKIVNQSESYFTISLDQPLDQDLSINWWIIN